MPDFFKKLKNIFRDKVGEADKRVREQIAKGCDWAAIDKDVLPDGGGGARIATVARATSSGWRGKGADISTSPEVRDTENPGQIYFYIYSGDPAGRARRRLAAAR